MISQTQSSSISPYGFIENIHTIWINYKLKNISENIGSVYRSSDTHNIKFIASWITFVYVWLRFKRSQK